jgi:hypothetical protein
MKISITAANLRLLEGDRICLSERRGRRFLVLLKRPRIRYVTNVTARGFSIAERKMTWTEWFCEWKALVSK